VIARSRPARNSSTATSPRTVAIRVPAAKQATSKPIAFISSTSVALTSSTAPGVPSASNESAACPCAQSPGSEVSSNVPRSVAPPLIEKYDDSIRSVTGAMSPFTVYWNRSSTVSVPPLPA
jgi:hypothetical protein